MEIDGVMEWYMQMATWEFQSESQSVSGSFQQSVESADKEP